MSGAGPGVEFPVNGSGCHLAAGLGNPPYVTEEMLHLSLCYLLAHFFPQTFLQIQILLHLRIKQHITALYIATNFLLHCQMHRRQLCRFVLRPTAVHQIISLRPLLIL